MQLERLLSVLNVITPQRKILKEVQEDSRILSSVLAVGYGGEYEGQ